MEKNQHTAFSDATLDQLKNFRQWGSLAAGHPEYGYMSGIETSTGPLGQGLATAVGMAIGERMMNARLGDEIINHFTYVMASDGDLMEGISQEAISLAGHLCLNKLVVLFDDNEITIDGKTSLSTSDDQLSRFQASGWNVCRIDGHNYDEIHQALTKAQTSDKPSLIACRTIIAKGSPNKAGTSASHGSPLGAIEVMATRECLNWHHDLPFVTPEPILNAWRKLGKKHQGAYHDWQTLYDNLEPEKKKILAINLPEDFSKKLKH
jgi:transketolase